MKIMDEMTQILTLIKDEKSAKESVPKIKKIVGQIKTIMQNANSYERPSKELEKKFEKKFGARSRKGQQAFQVQILRLRQKPNLWKIISPELK